MLKMAEQKVSNKRLNHFESGGTWVKRVFRFGTMRKRGLTPMLIAIESWTNHHPHSLGFQTGK